MARVCFVEESLICDSDNPIQNTNLLHVILVSAKSSTHFAIKGLLKSGLIQIEGFISPKSCEVVSVNHYGDAALFMCEATRRSDALLEAEVNKAINIALLPNRACISGSVHALNQLSQSAFWKSELSR